MRTFLMAQECAADRTSWRVDQIEKISKELHGSDCLTNSSKEQCGLIPGHAPFAISQLSLSFRSAG